MADQDIKMAPEEIQWKHDDFNCVLSKQLECLRKVNHLFSYSNTDSGPLYMLPYEISKPIIEEYKKILDDFETVCELRDKFLEKHPDTEDTIVK